MGPNCLQGLSADDKMALIMQRIEYFGRMAINSHGRQSTSQQGLQLMIWLLESFDLNSIKEAANTRNTKPTVRFGCSFHELSGPTLFLFPLTRPCFTGMGRSVDFF